MVTFTGLGLRGQFQAPRSALRVFGCWRSWVPESSAAWACESPTLRTGSSWRCGPSAQPGHAQPRTACPAAGPPGQGGPDLRTPGPSARSSAGEPALPRGFLPKLHGQQPWGGRRPAWGLEGLLSLQREGSFRGLRVKHEAHPGPHSMTRKTLRGGTTCFSEFSSSPLLPFLREINTR